MDDYEIRRIQSACTVVSNYVRSPLSLAPVHRAPRARAPSPRARAPCPSRPCAAPDALVVVDPSRTQVDQLMATTVLDEAVDLLPATSHAMVNLAKLVDARYDLASALIPRPRRPHPRPHPPSSTPSPPP